MMGKELRGMIVLLVVLMLAACGGNEEEVKPAAIEENDTCAICNMQVLDNEFATQVVQENGKSLVFDDIGCMYKWMDENNDKELKAEFVRDYNSKEWIQVDDATYVYDEKIKTPMAYNVISFKDKADAEKFIDENQGKILTASNLEQHEWKMNKEMMKKMKEENPDMDMDHQHDE